MNRSERAAKLVEVGAITAPRACHSKVRYVTRVQALGAAKKTGRKIDRKHVPYNCPFCEGYHIRKLRFGEEEGE